MFGSIQFINFGSKLSDWAAQTSPWEFFCLLLNVVQNCNKIIFTSLHWYTLHYTALYYNTLQYTEKHW